MSKANAVKSAEALFNYAVDALTAASNLTFDIEENGAPLKDAKEAMLHWAADAPDALKPRLQAMAVVRTKKGFSELTTSLEQHAERLRNEWQEVIKAAEAEQEEASAQGSELDQLASLSDRIHDLLAERMANTLAIGEALAKAKALFSKGSDFLKWADNACQLKKAQVYKWIKVWETFGGEPLFNGVAMRVLYTLTGYDESSDVYTEAVKVLDSGEVLDSKRLTAIIQDYDAPKSSPAPVTEPALVESDNAPAHAPESPSDAAEEGQEQEGGSPWEEEVSQPEAETEPSPMDDPAPAPVSASELTRRDRQIEELTARVAELTRLLEEAQKQAKHPAVAQLPPLPQFDQACPFAVLGLSQEAAGDAAAIKRAHRALAKLYNGQPEVSEKLMNARLALLGKAAADALIG